MTTMTRGACVVVGALLGAACTSDVSGDGAGPSLGRSSLLATFNSGNRIQSLGVDGDAVYWIENRGLYRCAKAGCNMQPTALSAVPADGSQPSLVSPFAGSGPLVVGGANIYWSTSAPTKRPIYTCPTAGCPGGPQVLAEIEASGSSNSLQADASGVYFAASGPSGMPRILTCPASGCAKSPAVVVEANGTQLLFALAGGRVYFWNANNNGGGSSTLPFGLISCPTSDCRSDVQTHYAIPATPGPGTSNQGAVIAADAASVYLALASTSGPGAALVRCDLPSCNGNLQILSASQVALSNNANTEVQVFLTPDAIYAPVMQCSGPCSEPTVAVCAKTGCPEGPTLIQPDVTFPISNDFGGSGGDGSGNVVIAVDTSGIYWIAVPGYYANARFLLRSPLK